MQAQIAAHEAYINPLQTYVDVDVTTDTDRPVVRVTGANLQIVNGAGSTAATPNGVGNLLVGYDEVRTAGDPVCSWGIYADESSCLGAGHVWSLVHKSGSHNVVIGREHNYSRYAGFVAGRRNTVNAIGASVSGGLANTASGNSWSSVSGGVSNTASGDYSSVSGGSNRTAAGVDDWVAGALFQDN
jgi:hypothetical protein